MPIAEINECDSFPCRNGATCVDLENEFECACPTGYEGVFCETRQSRHNIQIDTF